MSDGRMSDSRKNLNPIGLILKSARTGMAFVPFQEAGRDHFNCVVVDPGTDEKCRLAYPVGGYNIVVSAQECAESDEVGLLI